MGICTDRPRLWCSQVSYMQCMQETVTKKGGIRISSYLWFVFDVLSTSILCYYCLTKFLKFSVLYQKWTVV